MTEHAFHLCTDAEDADSGVTIAARSTAPAPAGDSAMLREFLENASDCVFLVDRDWRFTYLNRRAREHFAWRGELIGARLWDAFPEAAGSAFEQHYRLAMEAASPQTFTAQTPRGWFDLYASPLSDGGIGVWFRNVTPEKEAQERIRVAEERYGLAARATSDLVWDWDLVRDEICRNAPRQPRFGYPPDEVRGRRAWWHDHIHPDDRGTVIASIEAAIASDRERWTADYRFRRADGSYARIYDRAFLIRDGTGKATRMVGAMQDQTERQEALEALAAREAQLGTIFGQAMVGIVLSDADARLVMANARFCDIVGRGEEEMRGKTFATFTHPDDLVWNKPLFESHMARGEPYQIEKRYLRPDGSSVWCQVNCSPFADGRTAIIVVEDITERKQAEQALRESEALHRSVLEASADRIEILGADGRLERINRPGMAMMEIEAAEEVVGKAWTRLWPQAGRKAAQAAVEQAQAGIPARFTGCCPTVTGKPKWLDVVVTPMKDEAGEVVRLLAISRDITGQRETAEQLRRASEEDALTGLPNRRSFQAHLQAATIRAMGSGGRVGLLLLDIDHFKHVNDTLGHAAGDHLLRTFAKRIRASVRSADFIARLGGDEFAVVIEGVKAPEEVLAIGDAVARSLRSPARFEGRAVSGSATIGGAIFPADAASAHELFKNADTALYALKAEGRGGTKMFHSHMREQAQRVASQLSLARVALSEESVLPFYQPKVRLDDGRLDGFEALLRWRHPKKGIQLPETVAESFRDYQLASAIGGLMQAKVIEDIRRWQAAGFGFGRISLNAAPAEFLRDDYAERLLARLDAGAVAPDKIEVEVTEHVFLDRGSEYVGRALDRLTRAGVRIALDDFGTGYSSLSHLRDFPVDVVKIDKSFIDRMVDDAEIAAIVSAVIGLARSLSIEVVAEGIEREDQRDMLARQGCALGQGYLFGRPAEADEIEALVAG